MNPLFCLFVHLLFEHPFPCRHLLFTRGCEYAVLARIFFGALLPIVLTVLRRTASPVDVFFDLACRSPGAPVFRFSVLRLVVVRLRVLLG